jgi:diguanylate cyclase (GGDEF)-like protein
VSLKTKILVVLAIPVVVLAVTTALTSRAIRGSEAVLSQLGRSYQIREQISVVMDDLVDAETGVRGYLLTGRPGFLEPYTSGSASVQGNLDRLGASLEADGGEGALGALRAFVAERLSILADLKRSGDEGRSDGPDVLSQLRAGRLVMEDIRSTLDRMAVAEQARIDVREALVDDARADAFRMAVVGSPIGLLIALVVVVVYIQRTAARLRQVEENAIRLEHGEPMVAGDDDADDEIGRLGRAVVRSGTLAIELQGELEQLASADPLTGLANRRGFMPLLEHQLAIARRQGEPLSLLFIDLDGLKIVNDRLGHAMGDEMLQETAAILLDTFRTSDVPARLGGDEFCVMLPGESGAGAQIGVERLEGATRTANRLPGRPYELSLSVGIATFDPAHPREAEALIAEADRQMYRHKRAKRSDEPLGGAVPAEDSARAH